MGRLWRQVILRTVLTRLTALTALTVRILPISRAGNCERFFPQSDQGVSWPGNKSLIIMKQRNLKR